MSETVDLETIRADVAQWRGLVRTGAWVAIAVVPLITIGSVLAAAFVIAQGVGCRSDYPTDEYLQSGKFKMNALRHSHQWLNDATFTVNREAGTARSATSVRVRPTR